MVNVLDIVVKDFWPITAELYEGTVTTEGHPYLNRPPEGKFEL